MRKWKRIRYAGGERWYLEAEKEDLASVWGSLDLELAVYLDPRTGKPWKNMKAARAWFDSVTTQALKEPKDGE